MKSEKALNAAISTVQEPDNCSSVLYDALGQFAAVGAYDAPAVFGGGLLRVEVYDRQPRHLGDLRAVSVQCLPEHILQVGCGIGADQEDFIAPVGQPDGGCAGDRGLAYAAFAADNADDLFDIAHLIHGRKKAFRILAGRTFLAAAGAVVRTIFAHC